MTKEEVKLPPNGYKFRILECVKEKSQSSGQPMFTILCEMAENPPITVNGETVDINGLKGKKWISLQPKSIRTVNDFRNSCGFEDGDVSVEDLPNLEPAHFVGRVFGAVAQTKEGVQKDRETGKEVLNVWTGQPVPFSQLEIGQILRRN